MKVKTNVNKNNLEENRTILVKQKKAINETPFFALYLTLKQF